MITLVFFIIVSVVISYIDIKRALILDKIMFPSIAILILLKYFDGSLSLFDLYAVLIVLTIFMVPIMLNMAFGGGDLRFGVFVALFLGLQSIGLFVMFAGLLHLLLLAILKKKSFGFAPAMSIGAILAYIIGSSL